MTAYERATIRRLTGYVPGEQSDAPEVVKLNTNENPYPPAPAVTAALAGFDPERLRCYPHPTALAFRRVAAAVHGLAPENVIATNGGDELLRLVITTFVEPGETIGIATPGYVLYDVLAGIHDARITRVPLEPDWSLPADVAARLNAAGARLTLLVNPHAPSGYLTPAGRLAAIAEALDGVLLVDEAYVDFVDPALGHDATSLVGQLDNVLILRTLSKGYSLAGLRFGYGLGSESLITPMQEKTKDSYNTDAVSQRLAQAALEHRAEARRSWDAVRQHRDDLAAGLGEIGIGCAPSQTNFLLAEIGEEGDGRAAAVHAGLSERHVFVRFFDQDRLRNRLRITVGTPAQNAALIDALKATV